MKISINLLPPETIAEENKRAKFFKIQFVGVAVILTLIFLTSLTLALQILQGRNIGSVQAKLLESEQRVSDLKETEASLFLLKNRLTVINQYFGVPSKQSAIYNLIDKLTPSSVVVNAINVDKNDNVILSAVVPDSQNLDNFINNLLDKENNQDKISEVSIESLNRGKDGFYRISLKIKSK